MKQIISKIDTDYIKLEQLLKYSSLVESGGIAKLLIQDGHVLVNGEVCTQRGKKLTSGDEVQFEDYLIEVRGK